MSTQPLLHESTSNTLDLTCASLQMGELQRIFCQKSPDSGLEKPVLFEQPQSIPNTMDSVEYMPVREIPLFNNLREEFSEIFSSFIPVLKAKDAQLYRHSLRVHSLALSFTTTILQLSEAESLKIGLAAFFHDIGKLNIQNAIRSEEHTSELQSQSNLVCRLLLEKKKKFANLLQQCHLRYRSDKT